MQTALAETTAAPPVVNLATMFERLAANPDIQVEKLQALMDMQRSLLADNARVAFNAAMAAAQQEIGRVKADAYNSQTKSRYATYAALDRELRPIYSTHGLALSFNTAESNVADAVRVLCCVTHIGGHERVYQIDMPADGKGAKGGDVMTKTHAVGSASQYGMRYLLKMIFNVAIGDDDDGNGAGAKPQPVKEKPEGFDAWMLDLADAADAGLAALKKAWSAERSKPFREFVSQGQLEELKSKASRVTVEGK